LLDGIESAAKTCASEAKFIDAVNTLICEYFAKSSAGCPETLAARRRDISAHFIKENVAFSQVKEQLTPKLREKLGYLHSPQSDVERAANARVDQAVSGLVQPLLDVVVQAATAAGSAAAFQDAFNPLIEKFFSEASSPGAPAALAERRRELDAMLEKEKRELAAK